MRLVLAFLLVPLVASAAPGHRSITEGLDCSTCHTPDGWELAGSARGAGFDHARTGFPLTGAHKATTCSGCHGGAVAARPACVTCHRDEHAGRLGDACAECHTAIDWRDTRTLARHQRTLLPLTGRHALLECTACHVASAERQWTRVPAACFACHEQDYRRDLHPDHDGDAADPMLAPLSRDCGRCHRPTGWSPAVVDPTTLTVRRRLAAPADHDARFPLSFGKHRGAACSDCHPSAATPRRVACNGCHAGATLRAQHPGRLIGTSGAACLRCHPGGIAR